MRAGRGGRQTAGLQRPGFTWTLWYFLFVLLSITSGSSSYYFQLLPVLPAALPGFLSISGISCLFSPG